MHQWGKRNGPVDRAVEELDEKLAQVQHELRIIKCDPSRTAVNQTRGKRPSAKAVAQFIKDILTPPAKKPVTPSCQTHRDLFDSPAEPLKDLEGAPVAFAPRVEADLFSKTGAPLSQTAEPSAQIDCSTKPEEKLAHYLSAGSIKSYKPLKRVQRQTRNRFFMWIGLSLVALWFIYAVVR
jgi:hypothetical protein